ncbi:MAG: thioredoxin family protein [Candidatus Azobacteroides sp.]|nr:thioredoxin family protein [Candidatus Azobacteroides sp.]
MRYLICVSFIVCVVFLFVGAGTNEKRLTEGIQEGNLAPQINLQGVRLEGKAYVLVQFWAAYDPESRVENAKMHNVISRFKPENLQLISISFDENPVVFQGVVKADHLEETTQFDETEGKNSVLFKSYRLKKGFGNWLIDSNGVIVAKHVSPEKALEIISN